MEYMERAWVRRTVALLYLLVVYSLACIPPSSNLLDGGKQEQNANGPEQSERQFGSIPAGANSQKGGHHGPNCEYQCALYFCRTVVPFIRSIIDDLKLTDSLLVLFTGLLWWVTRDLVRLGARQEGLIRAQLEGRRAFVFVESYSPSAIIDLDDDGEKVITGWKIDARIRNAGDTQTKHLLTGLNWSTEECDAPDKTGYPDRADDARSPVMIGPKAFIDIDGPIIDCLSLQETVPEYESAQRRRIFIWGWIDYNDIFPETPRHRTEFCCEIVAKGDLQSLEMLAKEGVPLRFLNHPRHNGADDECMRKPQPYNPQK